jgi:hypothetical protein
MRWCGRSRVVGVCSRLSAATQLHRYEELVRLDSLSWILGMQNSWLCRSEHKDNW